MRLKNNLLVLTSVISIALISACNVDNSNALSTQNTDTIKTRIAQEVISMGTNVAITLNAPAAQAKNGTHSQPEPIAPAKDAPSPAATPPRTLALSGLPATYTPGAATTKFVVPGVSPSQVNPTSPDNTATHALITNFTPLPTATQAFFTTSQVFFDQNDYTGPCPTTFHTRANLGVYQAGTVKYFFMIHGVTETPWRTLTFSEPSTLQTPWEEYLVSVDSFIMIYAYAPDGQRISAQNTFHVKCVSPTSAPSATPLPPTPEPAATNAPAGG